MDISRQFISNPVRVWLTILLLGVGGIIALLNIGRLEDPAFTIKTAVVITHYPGASAQQVEEEVTLPLENASAVTLRITSAPSPPAACRRSRSI